MRDHTGRTLPYGICCLCGNKAIRPHSFICHRCQKAAQRKNLRLCASRDHSGPRLIPTTRFHPRKGHASCKACLEIQRQRALNPSIPPATDERSTPAYASHRAAIISLLLGKPL